MNSLVNTTIYIASSVFVEGDGWIVNEKPIAAGENEEKLVEHCKALGYKHFFKFENYPSTDDDIPNQEVKETIIIQMATLVR